jgi:transposase
MARQRRQYTIEFKQEAVRLVKEQALSPTEVARDLGLDRSLIRDWIKKSEAGQLVAAPVRPPSAPSLDEEVRRLRNENAVLREEREILKKAAAFFAKETR